MIYVVAAIIVLIASFVIALITLANESKKGNEVVSKELPIILPKEADTHFTDIAGSTKDEAVARLEQVIAKESEKESEIPGKDEIIEEKLEGDIADERREAGPTPKEPFPWEIDSESSDSESNQVNEASSKNVFDPPKNTISGSQPSEHVISIADLARQQREDV